MCPGVHLRYYRQPEGGYAHPSKPGGQCGAVYFPHHLQAGRQGALRTAHVSLLRPDHCGECRPLCPFHHRHSPVQESDGNHQYHCGTFRYHCHYGAAYVQPAGKTGRSFSNENGAYLHFRRRLYSPACGPGLLFPFPPSRAGRLRPHRSVTGGMRPAQC